MRTADVIRHFKTQGSAAKALNITQPSVALWGEYPPDKRQLQIERITRGALQAEPGCFERITGIVSQPLPPVPGLPPGVTHDRRDPNRISPYAGTDIDRRAPAGGDA